jgi:type II secretory pathway pseudopilin PulG
MARRIRATLRDDRGFTLSELIVVGVITTIILMTITGMYLSTIQAERTVNALSETTNAAQLTARSIDYGVRNGVILRPLEPGTDGGQLLVVCTAGADAQDVEHKWQAWYYSPSGEGEIRTRTFPKDAAPDVPTAAEFAQWTLLVAGVQPLRDGPLTTPDGDPTIFAVASDDPDAPDAELSKVSIKFFATGRGAGSDSIDSATIDFASRLAPHPSYSPSAEPKEPCT